MRDNGTEAGPPAGDEAKLSRRLGVSDEALAAIPASNAVVMPPARA